jgi:Zn-dependent peptidase ImmA (M78 family)/transcriptional regulator with XRE-family HTH domain
MKEKVMKDVPAESKLTNAPPDRNMIADHTFTRTCDHLMIARPGTASRTLSAAEALDVYGAEVIHETLEYGSAILRATVAEPGVTLRKRREELGLTIQVLASRTGLTPAAIEQCEEQFSAPSIQNLEKVAISLGLDERLVSFKSGAGGDDGLAVRLKTMSGNQNLSAEAVLTFGEAAWVIRAQYRLESLLGASESPLTRFEVSENYGAPDYPTYRHGYFLADQTRRHLGLPRDTRIDALRTVCESLRIPILWAELPNKIAGATVVTNGCRGIVINTTGQNSNVWVRRATIAHELGHLLWDPESRLNNVVVDEYSDLAAMRVDRPDPVEARANAFAMALLAPPSAVESLFDPTRNRADELQKVMNHFGISFTAAKNHVGNVLNLRTQLQSIRVADHLPPDDWTGRESYTNEFFPLKETSTLRRGRFAGLVVTAESAGIISEDTARMYLQTDLTRYREAKADILALYSDIPTRSL